MIADDGEVNFFWGRYNEDLYVDLGFSADGKGYSCFGRGTNGKEWLADDMPAEFIPNTLRILLKTGEVRASHKLNLKTISYDTAREDYLYIVSMYGNPYGMQELKKQQADKLIHAPDMNTAKRCYIERIFHWFLNGPEGILDSDGKEMPSPSYATHRAVEDSRIADIYDRYDPVC